jgi:hypothetical protein
MCLLTSAIPAVLFRRTLLLLLTLLLSLLLLALLLPLLPTSAPYSTLHHRLCLLLALDAAAEVFACTCCFRCHGRIQL